MSTYSERYAKWKAKRTGRTVAEEKKRYEQRYVAPSKTVVSPTAKVPYTAKTAKGETITIVPKKDVVKPMYQKGAKIAVSRGVYEKLPAKTKIASAVAAVPVKAKGLAARAGEFWEERVEKPVRTRVTRPAAKALYRKGITKEMAGEFIARTGTVQTSPFFRYVGEKTRVPYVSKTVGYLGYTYPKETTVGILKGWETKPVKTTAIATAAFFVPAVTKVAGAGGVAVFGAKLAPVAATATKVGMGTIYGASVGTRVYAARPGMRTERFGEIVGTEAVPFAAGQLVGTKFWLTPKMIVKPTKPAKVYGKFTKRPLQIGEEQFIHKGRVAAKQEVGLYFKEWKLAKPKFIGMGKVVTKPHTVFVHTKPKMIGEGTVQRAFMEKPAKFKLFKGKELIHRGELVYKGKGVALTKKGTLFGVAGKAAGKRFAGFGLSKQDIAWTGKPLTGTRAYVYAGRVRAKIGVGTRADIVQKYIAKEAVPLEHLDISKMKAGFPLARTELILEPPKAIMPGAPTPLAYGTPLGRVAPFTAPTFVAPFRPIPPLAYGVSVAEAKVTTPGLTAKETITPKPRIIEEPKPLTIAQFGTRSVTAYTPTAAITPTVVQRQVTRTVTKTPTPGVPIVAPVVSPYVGMPIPYTPLIPSVPFMPFLRKPKKKKAKARKRKYEYRPSLVAGYFKWFGKKPKKITGLEVRPLLKKKKKKKRKKKKGWFFLNV